jgi:D-alanyl-lipoteichoic acid acyltransferase DltB (MBOAT superfamily)
MVFSVVTLGALHGSSLIKILVIISINYVMTRNLKSMGLAEGVKLPLLGKVRFDILLIWIFCLGILFVNEFYDGYSFHSLLSILGLGQLGSWLDQYKGLVPRWKVHFNLMVLRMISFSCDYLWSAPELTPSSSLSPKREVKLEIPTQKDLEDDRAREQTPLDTSFYDYFHYLIYCLYIPLYLAGPIISYNSFYSQILSPKPSLFSQNISFIPSRKVLAYILRWFAAFLLMELMMHYIYVVSMSKEKRNVWGDFTVVEVAMYAYFNLKFIWLKVCFPPN